MRKLEPIDGKVSNWLGLWWHPECNAFYSSVISLSDIRKFKGKVRIMIRKNKYFNGGENNRPNYCFCIRDAEAPVFDTIEVEEDEHGNHGNDVIALTREELQIIINKVACEVGGNDWFNELLVEDFIS